jgi:hypothetical protein
MFLSAVAATCHNCQLRVRTKASTLRALSGLVPVLVRVRTFDNFGLQRIGHKAGKDNARQRGTVRTQNYQWRSRDRNWANTDEKKLSGYIMGSVGCLTALARVRPDTCGPWKPTHVMRPHRCRMNQNNRSRGFHRFEIIEESRITLRVCARCVFVLLMSLFCWHRTFLLAQESFHFSNAARDVLYEASPIVGALNLSWDVPLSPRAPISHADDTPGYASFGGRRR